MAFKHGKNGNIKVDDSAGVVRDVSPYVNDVEPNFEIDLPETTTLGNNSKRRQVVGLQDASVSIQGFHDTTANVGPWPLFTGLKGAANTSTITWGPEGTTSGLPRVTGEFRLKSFKTGNSVDGVIPFTAEMVADGDTVIDVFP